MEIKRVQGVRGPMRLPSEVPEITAEQLDAVVLRSGSAAGLRDELDAKLREGHRCSRHDVERMVARGRHKDGRVDANHAVVLAYYAQKHRHVFDPDAEPLVVQFIGDADWTALMIELDTFIEKLREQAREAEKKRELDKERFEDDVLKPEERRLELKKENGTVEERKDERVHEELKKSADQDRLREASITDVEDELTGSGRVKLSDAELAKLGLMKRGFANRK